MQHVITSDQRSFYQENGYLLISNFLDEAETTHWRTTVDFAVQKQRGKVLTGQPAGDKPHHYDNVFLQQMLLSRISEEMRNLIHDEALAKIAADIAAIPGIQLWHDQALIKEPFANPTAFHRDVPFWSFDSNDAISYWIALDDATPNNGCLHFLPGSHKSQDYTQTNIGENVGEIFHLFPELTTIKPQPVPVKAGDCVFFNGMVVHGAGANMTPDYRRAMTCGLMPKHAKFNGKRNILSENYFRSLTIGEPLDNYEELPLLYQRPGGE